MTVDKVGTLQKAEVSLHEKSEGGFKPLALDDVTTMYSNADYHKTQSTAAEASKEKIASPVGTRSFHSGCFSFRRLNHL